MTAADQAVRHARSSAVKAVTISKSVSGQYSIQRDVRNGKLVVSSNAGKKRAK
jgi:hypothetical protein